ADVRRVGIRVTLEDADALVDRGHGIGREPIQCPARTRTIVRLEEDVHADIRARLPSQAGDRSHRRRDGRPLEPAPPGYRLRTGPNPRHAPASIQSDRQTMDASAPLIVARSLAW